MQDRFVSELGMPPQQAPPSCAVTFSDSAQHARNPVSILTRDRCPTAANAGACYRERRGETLSVDDDPIGSVRAASRQDAANSVRPMPQVESSGFGGGSVSHRSFPTCFFGAAPSVQRRIQNELDPSMEGWNFVQARDHDDKTNPGKGGDFGTQSRLLVVCCFRITSVLLSSVRRVP